MNFLLSAVFLIFSVSVSAGMTENKDSSFGGKAVPTMEGNTIRIDLNHKGEIFLDGELRTLSGVKEFFEERSGNPEDKILIVADQEALQEDVIAIMDVCSNYKYQKIKLFYKPSWIHKG
ncbi:MAG: biopolymer transporter ExbD [Lentisphaeraceae bacterium]|nr:biopolymer transporter ExbD [Lentisphaeraceae bacterium]